MIRIKPGVSLDRLEPVMWGAIPAIHAIYQSFGEDLWITSGTDGRHKVGSFHPKGLALDVRSWNIPSEKHGELCAQLRQFLGAPFQVILEDDHIHIEFDEKESAR